MNSPNPRISVVVCTYNRCDTLKEMLDSLAQMSVPQDFPWELVVVDNNSKDKTRQVVESFVQSSGLNAKYTLERLAAHPHIAGLMVVLAADDGRRRDARIR